MRTKYKTILLLAAAVVLCSAVLCAAEEEKEDFWGDKGPTPKHPRFELTEERIERIMSRLAEANPEKAQELAKLREKDPEEFKAELRRIMRQRFGKEVRERETRQTAGRRPRPARTPRKPAARSASGRTRRGPRRPPRPIHERYKEFLEWLQENYPQETKRLAELKKEKPELYKERIGLILKKYREIFEAERHSPELAEILKTDLKLKNKRHQLLKKIREATSDEEREELTGQLEEVISGRFDLLVRRKRIEYEHLLERLQRLQERVKESEAKVDKWKDADFKEESVAARLEELISGAEEFRWD